MARATLIATLAEPPSGDGQELRGLGAADWLEVRADRIGDLDPDWLRQRFPGRLLYTLRSVDEGGGFGGGEAERQRRLLAAARRGYDAIDLEAERDLAAPILAAIAAERRFLSWHGPAPETAELRERAERMLATGAALYKLVPTAAEVGGTLLPLALLRSLDRGDLVAFAGGPLGVWTRLVAPRLGAPVVYGAAGDTPGAPGQPSLRRLIDDFGLPELRAATLLCGVVGNPIAHSLSPRLHNALYRATGVPFLYIPFCAESFGDFWLEIVESGSLAELGLPWRGLSVTAPFKPAALAVAGASSPLAERVGGANTLVLTDGVWEAESTDPLGVVVPLELRGLRLRERRALVVGCGGAGRAAAVGLLQAGAEVVLTNRGEQRGRAAAAELGAAFAPLAEIDLGRFAIVVNATALGRAEDDPLPFDPAALSAEAAVVDMVYEEGPTRLVRAARQRSLAVVDGREVLLQQGLAQFRLMTGREAPLAVGLAALGLRGPASEGPG